MIPLDTGAEHYKAFVKWRSLLADAREGGINQDIFAAMAAIWQMRYECLVAQLKVEMKSNG